MKTWSAWVFVLLLVLPAAVRAAGKEKPPKSLDPYGTAERETPQPLATTDLAYRVVVFDEIDIPDNLKKDNAKYVDQTKTQAMTRLRSTQAFTKVDVKTDTIPDEPFLLVKCVVLDHHIVGGGSRFFAGALAGKSHVVYQVKLFDGKSGDLLHDTRLSTANNAFAGAFLSNDKKLVPYLGNVIADYVALRARSDKGVSVIPLDWPPPAK
ncbi:MAG TPA: hypothetical protein VMX54_09590 [Vicinamibacteria bacterium]|nr:hypothetical protein [Vicinamibacteria bacterium]